MNPYRNIAAVLMMFALNATGTVAFAQKNLIPVNPGTLMVSIEEKIEGDFDKDALMEALCEKVAAGLTADKGVFGLGVFTGIDCEGKDPSKNETIFRMTLGAGAEKATLAIMMATPQRPTLPVASISFKHGGRLVELLEDESFSALIASALNDQLPMQIRFDGKSKEKRHTVTNGEKQLLADGIAPPAAFFAYSATMDGNGLIFPSAVGRIVLKAPAGKRSSYLHESGSADSTLVWKLETKMKKLPPVFFGLPAGGRGAVGAGMQDKVAARAGKLVEEINQGVFSKSAKAIGQAFGGGFLGLRYGPALLEGDLIDQSKYFGALVEFRSGWLDGLRIYYDYWPEVSGTINGQEGTFGGKRTILAYSLALKFDSWIRTIDLTPKIGLWSFRSKAPIELEPGVYVSPEFEVKRAPSFDIELGVETASSIHILRGWFSRAATFLSTGSNDAKIASTRVGMDLLLSPWGASKPVTVSLLSFYFFEAVELNKSQKVEGEDAELDQLNYSQAYAGGGLAISW